MPLIDWASKSELSAAQLAVVEQNWAIAQRVLDGLTADLARHRATGCTKWACAGPVAELVAGLDEPQIHMLMRAALERLATAEPRPPTLSVWTGVIGPDCVCDWLPDDDGGFRMTLADPACALHGRGKVFDAWTWRDAGPDDGADAPVTT